MKMNTQKIKDFWDEEFNFFKVSSPIIGLVNRIEYEVSEKILQRLNELMREDYSRFDIITMMEKEFKEK